MNTFFKSGSALAAFGWMLLIFAPLVANHAERLRRIAGLVIPSVLAGAYVVVVIASLRSATGGFSSLTEVRTLFANDGMLVAGWFHYLAFDLLVGTWIARESVRRNIPHWLIVPCLAMTFLFGPAGLVLFFIVRASASRAFFKEVSHDK